MGYLQDVREMTAFLNAKASEGFASEPVPCRYDRSRMEQRSVFSPEEQRRVRLFCSSYHSVLSRVDYAIDPFSRARTASLCLMLIYMAEHETSPSYVSQNAARLEDALDTHGQSFKNLDMEKEFSGGVR